MRWLFLPCLIIVLAFGGGLFYKTSIQGAVSVSALVPEIAASTTINVAAGTNFTFTNINNTAAILDFPVNFYSQNLTLKAYSYAKDYFAYNKPAPSGKSFVGKAYDFNLLTASGSQISTISASATITLSYSNSDLNGLDGTTVAPYRWGASDSSWQLISGATIDTANSKITFSTASFSSFALFATPSQPQQQSSGGSSSGGGGGGGGGYVTSTVQTVAVFRGKAYPSSDITLLKDAVIVATTKASPDATFEITVSNLSAGTYSFGIWAEDTKGLRSTTQTFNISITSGVTTLISGIFLPPTISIDKVEVKKGDVLNIFGQTAPQSQVSITINSGNEILKKTLADGSGVWLYEFDTDEIDYGDHSTRSKSSYQNNISAFSQVAFFKVGNKNIFATQPKKCPLPKYDINSDCKVDLVDFSILAYWFLRASPPPNVDLNGDGIVDLVDFSILAYYWTG